jgi:hypothetical protein
LEKSEDSEPGENPASEHKHNTDTYLTDNDHPYAHTMHDSHPNYDHHALSAVWSEELQGIADKTSRTEDRESWRILKDLQKTAQTLATKLGRHPDKLSTDEYERVHILAADKKHFLQTPLDKSKYVLLVWQTTLEFANLLF